MGGEEVPTPMTASLFTQAFDEVEHDVTDLASAGDAARWGVLDRLRTPDRVLHFSVRWLDDDGHVRINKAWRVQHCGALGPYKGGLRFDPGVNEDTLRFLAFEQSFKNALTGLPMGGGKGGADIDPKTCSPTEIMRFCHAFMDEYVRYGGPDTDVPAGDIGVGSREIGYLFGRYLKIRGRHDGAFTGKPELLGGIPGRDEATGYGAVRFAMLMLREKDDLLDGKRVVISGAGNVALHAAQRCIKEGATVVSLSDRSGTLVKDDGLSAAEVGAIAQVKASGKGLEGSIKGVEHRSGATPWSVKGDVYMPCATQNELDELDAQRIADMGGSLVVEGANMPCTDGAVRTLRERGVARAPGKAANAGGVAVSGLEMSQNASRYPWTKQRTLEKLDEIMDTIHALCAESGREDGGSIDYSRGANRASFKRLAGALASLGVS